MHVPLATTIVDHRAGRAMQGVGAPFEELFDGVDDLIKRVADTENPEIRKIRAKVHASMVVAKSAFGEGSPAARRAEGHFERERDEYGDQALGVALLVGVGIGVIMSIQP